MNLHFKIINFIVVAFYKDRQPLVPANKILKKIKKIANNKKKNMIQLTQFYMGQVMENMCLFL